MAIGSGDGRGEVGVATAVVGAAVTRGVASGESLAAPKHAAVTKIRKIATHKDETTSASLGISITYLKPYHSLARQGGPDLMRIQ